MAEPKITGMLGRWLPAVLVSALIFILTADGNALLASEDVQTVFGRLSDCFFIPGALFAGFGAITWMATTGVYDMLSYGGHYAVDRLKQIVGKKDITESYYDYKEAKAEKRGSRWKSNWLIVGVIQLLLSGVCLAVYLLL